MGERKSAHQPIDAVTGCGDDTGRRVPEQHRDQQAWFQVALLQAAANRLESRRALGWAGPGVVQPKQWVVVECDSHDRSLLPDALYAGGRALGPV